MAVAFFNNHPTQEVLSSRTASFSAMKRIILAEPSLIMETPDAFVASLSTTLLT
jgi:hypothetical protein